MNKLDAIKTLAKLAPVPWEVDEDGNVRDAVGDRVWDVRDANDSPEVAQAVVALVNAVARGTA